jgi:TPR repeat protein
VKRDLPQAFHWFAAAAKSGHAVAEANLADIYANGRGAPLNYLEAYKSFSLSGAPNYAVAVNARKALVSIMNASLRTISASTKALRLVES